MNETKSRDQMAFERMVFFSDGVFAIAITLLVIMIKVPSIDEVASNAALADALVRIVPQLIGFVVSFLLIGQTWVEHHRISLFIQGFDRGLLWWNLLLLLFVALLPFTTALLSTYYLLSYAVIFYAVLFAALGLTKALLWRHAVRKNLLGQHTLSLEAVRIGRRVWATPVTSIVVVVLAIVGVPLAYFGFMLIPLVALILDRTAPKKATSTK